MTTVDVLSVFISDDIFNNLRIFLIQQMRLAHQEKESGVYCQCPCDAKALRFPPPKG